MAYSPASMTDGPQPFLNLIAETTVRINKLLSGVWQRPCFKCWRTLTKNNLDETVTCECGWTWHG